MKKTLFVSAFLLIAWNAIADNIGTNRYQNGNEITCQVVTKEGESGKEEATDNLRVTRSGNTYYYNGMPMKNDVYESFLQERCLSAYNQYRSGRGLASGGWVMLGGAAGLSAVLVIFSRQDWFQPYIWAIPGVMTAASVPLLIGGYNRMHRSADTFNTMCADKQSQAYWSINASQDGIGVALHF